MGPRHPRHRCCPPGGSSPLARPRWQRRYSQPGEEAPRWRSQPTRCRRPRSLRSNSKLSVVPAAPDGVYRTVAVLTTAAASGVRPESEPLEGLAQSGVGSPTASIDHIQNLAAISKCSTSIMRGGVDRNGVRRWKAPNERENRGAEGSVERESSNVQGSPVPRRSGAGSAARCSPAPSRATRESLSLDLRTVFSKVIWQLDTEL